MWSLPRIPRVCPQTFFAFPIAFIFCVPPLYRSVAVKPNSRPSLPFPSTTTPRSFSSVSLLLPFCRSFSVGWSLQTAIHALSSFAAVAALAAVANAQGLSFKFPPGPAVNLPQSSTCTPQQEFRYRGCANLNNPTIFSAFDFTIDGAPYGIDGATQQPLYNLEIVSLEYFPGWIDADSPSFLSLANQFVTAAGVVSTREDAPFVPFVARTPVAACCYHHRIRHHFQCLPSLDESSIRRWGGYSAKCLIEQSMFFSKDHSTPHTQLAVCCQLENHPSFSLP